MRHNIYAVAAATVGLLATACSGSPQSGTSTTTSGTPTKVVTTTVSQATTTSAAGPTSVAGTDLRSLIPTPPNTNRTDGPDPVHDNGIHLHFFVNGSPTDVMSAYKTALLGMKWTLIVDSSSGGAGGGGATYTASNGNVFGAFSGGGFGTTTDIDACAWPSEPVTKDCGRHG
ncbi:MAG TPA: hypothetical protein VFW69_16015 [Mycobacterium sp.]|nr:hypothetical protein [Mycobacterium sp.]